MVGVQRVSAATPQGGDGRMSAPLVRLYGEVGAFQISAAHVVIVGIGGVGSWVAEGLARSGVGKLTLVDMDHVAPSNVNRQVHAMSASLGMSKVGAMADRISGFGLNTHVESVDAFVSAANWPSLIGDAKVDMVVDACDDFAAKLCIAAWALRGKCASVIVGAAGGKTQAHRACLADLRDVTHDPLLAKLRYALRRSNQAARAGSIGLTCVSSDEPICGAKPKSTDSDGEVAGSALACHGYGSSVAVTATFGFVAVGHVLNRLAAGVR